MSEPRPIYEALIQDLANGELTDLQKKIFELLQENPDGLDRFQLVHNIYGYIPVTLEGNTDDRKIRKAIERLRQRLFPVVSTSGKPGYRLDVSREAVEKMIGELRSRRNRLDEQIEAASKFYNIPISYQPDPNQVKQMELAL